MGGAVSNLSERVDKLSGGRAEPPPPETTAQSSPIPVTYSQPAQEEFLDWDPPLEDNPKIPEKSLPIPEDILKYCQQNGLQVVPVPGLQSSLSSSNQNPQGFLDWDPEPDPNPGYGGRGVAVPYVPTPSQPTTGGGRPTQVRPVIASAPPGGTTGGNASGYDLAHSVPVSLTVQALSQSIKDPPRFTGENWEDFSIQWPQYLNRIGPIENHHKIQLLAACLDQGTGAELQRRIEQDPGGFVNYQVFWNWMVSRFGGGTPRPS